MIPDIPKAPSDGPFEVSGMAWNSLRDYVIKLSNESYGNDFAVQDGLYGRGIGAIRSKYFAPLKLISSTAAGKYAGQVYVAGPGGSSNSAKLTEDQLGYIGATGSSTSAEAVEIWNLAECSAFGSSVAAAGIPLNKGFMPGLYAGRNPTTGQAIYYAMPVMPGVIAVTLAQTAGTNGTVSGGVPTFSTGTYTVVLSGTTLATGQTITWATPRPAGQITWASAGLAQINTVGTNVNVMVLSGNELPSGGVVC